MSTGSWETVVGELDTFGLSIFHLVQSIASLIGTRRHSVHILEYENYGGLDKSTALIRKSKVGFHQALKLCKL